MYEVKRLNLDELNPDLIPSYEALTTPRNRRFLHMAKKEDYLILAAYHVHKPIGLIIASVNAKAYTAEIHSLYVLPEHRRHNIGTQLLEALECELKSQKVVVVTFIYPSDSPTTAYFEKMLSSHHWAEPKLHMIHYFFDAQKFRPPWHYKDYSYPPHIQRVFWKDLSQKDLKDLKRREEQYSFPRIVSPLQNQENIEPTTSLLLRNLAKNSQIIGWSITHRVQHDTLSYGPLYIEPEYRNKGYAIFLLIESMHLQEAGPIKWAEFNLNIDQSEPNWRNFIQRRIAAWGTQNNYKMSWKDLKERRGRGE